MLLNTYFHTLDAKGRIILPAKMRDELGTSFIIAKGLGEKCICAYPTAEFTTLAEPDLQSTFRHSYGGGT